MKKKVDTYSENLFYILAKIRQLLNDLNKMPFFLKLRMIWVILGYLEHQKKLNKMIFYLIFVK